MCQVSILAIYYFDIVFPVLNFHFCLIGLFIPVYLSTGIAERPTFHQLFYFSIRGKPVDVIEMIGTKYYKFGVSLLQDDTGVKMEAIVEQCREDATKINRQVLSRWLRGEGKQPVTWATLATELELCGLNELAKDIRTEKSK